MAYNRLSMCLEMSGARVSQFGNYNFSSLCNFNGVLLGGNEDGLFVLNSGDEDAGEKIDAQFSLITTDFGLPNQKRVRRIYFGWQSDGKVKVKVSGDGKDPVEIEALPGDRNLREHSNAIAVGRDAKGRFLDLNISNVDGSDFTFGSVEVVLVVLGPKPKEGV